MSADPRDIVLFADAPTLMVPRFGTLPDLACGRRRYLAAADGFYLQARSPVLDLCVRLAPVSLPYGPLSQYVQLLHGGIPESIGDELTALAIAGGVTEIAALVVAGANGYEVIQPPVESASAGHVRYRRNVVDEESVVVDVHSHGPGAAYFSPVDDAGFDRCGVHYSVVFGRCTGQLEWACRLCVHGTYFDLDHLPWRS